MQEAIKHRSVLQRSFYTHDTVVVAKRLLGKTIIHQYDGIVCSGMIVETEAYSGVDDPASHAYPGITKRNASMFGPVGHAYVYFIYGNHFCFNVVARAQNQTAGAVLIRAVQPLQGIEHMVAARKTADLHNLTNGPGKLTQALGITREYNVCDLTQPIGLYIAYGQPVKSENIVVTSRIGIKKASDKQWRFYISGNQFVSR